MPPVSREFGCPVPYLNQAILARPVLSPDDPVLDVVDGFFEGRRRRGVWEALVWARVAEDPGLPAVAYTSNFSRPDRS
ncbi:MAG TPA: hypothetical protein VG034_24780 [Acidimicrobiia bacterium]|nr:hypothetical protein [Acidimicrobiia bacterium]